MAAWRREAKGGEGVGRAWGSGEIGRTVEGKIDSIVKSKLQGNEQLAAGSRD